MNAHLYDGDWDYYDSMKSKDDDDDFNEPDKPEEDLNAECVW
jgi:hypothetical protein